MQVSVLANAPAHELKNSETDCRRKVFMSFAKPYLSSTPLTFPRKEWISSGFEKIREIRIV